MLSPALTSTVRRRSFVTLARSMPGPGHRDLADSSSRSMFVTSTDVPRSVAASGEVVVAARFSRESELFTEVHDRYFTVIYRHVASRLGAQAAEDVAAESFLVPFDRRTTFDAERGDLRVWLFGIATNLVARYRRKEARHYRRWPRLDAVATVEGHEGQSSRR